MIHILATLTAITGFTGLAASAATDARNTTIEVDDRDNGVGVYVCRGDVLNCIDSNEKSYIGIPFVGVGNKARCYEYNLFDGPWTATLGGSSGLGLSCSVYFTTEGYGCGSGGQTFSVGQQVQFDYANYWECWDGQ